MSIRIVQEEKDLGFPYEDCCFCGKGTSYWGYIKNVPVCLTCSREREESEVPCKEVWVRRGPKARNIVQKQNPPAAGKPKIYLVREGTAAGNERDS